MSYTPLTVSRCRDGRWEALPAPVTGFRMTEAGCELFERQGDVSSNVDQIFLSRVEALRIEPQGSSLRLRLRSEEGRRTLDGVCLVEWTPGHAVVAFRHAEAASESIDLRPDVILVGGSHSRTV